MKLEHEEDVTQPKAVTPVFSGALPASTLPIKTEVQRELFHFEDEDRDAVAAVLDQEPDRNGRG